MYGELMNPNLDSMLPPGDVFRKTFDTALMGLECKSGGNEAAGRAADDRWDEQVEIAFDTANDNRDYTMENMALSYNDAVLANEIQQRNLDQQTLWQEHTAMRAWDAEAQERVFEFNSQVAAYNKSERLFGAQVGLNNYARRMADDSAAAVQAERLDAVKFQGMAEDLKLSQTKADIDQQRAGLNIGRVKARTNINQQQQAASLQRQQQRAESAFNSEKQLVELMQAAGSMQAKGQSGRSAQKNIQAIMAAGGRAQAQLADQITRGDSAYNLTMMGLDKSLIYGEAEGALAQTALTTKGAYADLTYGLGQQQRDASKLSIRSAYGRALDKAEFDEYGANLAADAQRMSEPGFAPLPPKPLELPEAILMDPMLPMDLPEVRMGAGSGGVGAAQGRAQDQAMIVNAFVSLASAGLGAAIKCDMRVKHEVASLEYTEVDDTLSKLAFAVKALREHS
jgi:hypothetical protein